ncbi:MAG: hypothetical protein ACE5H2_07570 [Terriglobia bacterium]
MTGRKLVIGVAAVLAAALVASVVVYAWDLVRLVPWAVYIGATVVVLWAGRELGPGIWVLVVAAAGIGVVVWWKKRRKKIENRVKAAGRPSGSLPSASLGASRAGGDQRKAKAHHGGTEDTETEKR